MTARLAMLTLLTACSTSSIRGTSSQADRALSLPEQIAEEQCDLLAQCSGEFIAGRDCETAIFQRVEDCDYDEYWAAECVADLSATQCNGEGGFARPVSCDLVWTCAGGDGDDFGH